PTGRCAAHPGGTAAAVQRTGSSSGKGVAMTRRLGPGVHARLRERLRAPLHRHVRLHARTAAGLVLVAVAVLGAAGTTPASGRAPAIAARPVTRAEATEAPPERPNIVLFMTDDQNR